MARRSVAVLERRFCDFTAVPSCRDMLFASLGNLAVTPRAAGRTGEALDALGRGAVTLEDLVKSLPDVPDPAWHLAVYLSSRSELGSPAGGVYRRPCGVPPDLSPVRTVSGPVPPPRAPTARHRATGPHAPAMLPRRDVTPVKESPRWMVLLE
jgi:hypothetical protein